MTQCMQMIEELDDCFVRTAMNVMKYYVDEKEQKKALGQLRLALMNNCIECTRVDIASKVRDQMMNMQEYEPEANANDIVKEYKKAISEIQIDSSKNSRLVEYDRQIEDLREASQAASSKGLDDTDSDLRLTCQEVNVIDPISKTRMTDPVKNAVCGHVYERGNLIAMLQRNKKTRCPVIGCTSTNYIDMRKCRIDIATKVYLEKNLA